MYVSVLVRRLRPGKTLDDFVTAWYPTRGFGFPAKVFLARHVSSDDEVVTIGLHDTAATVEELRAEIGRVAEQEAIRHELLGEVVESTTVRGLYEVEGLYDFATDESVEASRPWRS